MWAARSAWAVGCPVAVRPTSPSPLSGPLGRGRRYRWSGLPLLDLLVIKDHLGVTLNDVVLGGLSNGVRELPLELGTAMPIADAGGRGTAHGTPVGRT